MKCGRQKRRSLLLFLVGVMASFAVACTAEPAERNEAVERGRQTYQANCRMCHGNAATGAGRIATAPSHGPDGHTWHHPDGQLVDIVLGRLDYPGRTMPSFGEGAAEYAVRLSEEEVRAVLAYFKTGWTADQRQFQAEASRNWESQRR
ncbi:MAG: cytochrome c [Chloroflexi bacterium]|nr:cytochrome c [Chloroflexota bacterium]